MHDNRNIVLIGMPWSGKSTVGVLLAKELSRPFVDTDVVIQAGEGRRLQAIIDSRGVEALRAVEERYVLAMDLRGHVVATGGSLVYSAPAMPHLKEHGCCVYLRLPLDALEARATRVDTRGLVRAPGQSLHDLYEERAPLYERYADVAVDCAECTHEQVVGKVADSIAKRANEA